MSGGPKTLLSIFSSNIEIVATRQTSNSAHLQKGDKNTRATEKQQDTTVTHRTVSGRAQAHARQKMRRGPEGGEGDPPKCSDQLQNKEGCKCD